jgi:hypothetical protein
MYQDINVPSISGFKVVPVYGEWAHRLTWNPINSGIFVQKSLNYVHWETIAELPKFVDRYVDTTCNINNTIIHYTYRLVAEDGRHSQPMNAFKSDSKELNGTLNFIINETILSMRSGSGIKVNLLIPRVENNLCPDCVDVDTGQVLNTLCKSCGGTGRVQGYYEPISTYIRFVEAEKRDTAAANPQGAALETLNTVTCLNIPEIIEGCVFYHVSQDCYYMVNAMEIAKLAGRIPILVTAAVKLLNRDHPIYRRK